MITRFTLATVVAALPFLVDAVPAPQSHAPSTKIPIQKRSTLTQADGTVDFMAVKAHVDSIKAYVSSLFGYADPDANLPHS